MKSSRRSFLQTAAGATALAALPPNLLRALADPLPSRTGTIMDVEHVVVLMQENRSFDHYFGMLNGVRGFSDPRAIRLPEGNPVWYQPYRGKTFTPFRLDTHSTSAQCLHSLDHSWKGSYDRWENHDAWIETKTKLTMGYFTRHDIPFYCALADAFTICDAYYCSVFGPTTPNRLHLFSGTSGLTVGHDAWAVANPNEYNETANIRHDSKDFHAFRWTTYAEALQDAGIDWRLYQEYDNYGDNGLAYFRNFRDPYKHRALLERGRSWVKGSNARNAKASRGEHLVSAFERAVARDRLPQVSWIVAPYIMCEHPSATPGYGENLVFRLLDSLAKNKSVWAKTAFILNYDENDGFFDHMPPPIPPISSSMGASTVDVSGEIYRGVPFGFGPRVPMLVVSPWTVGGFVNSEVFDHTSVLRFLEARFEIAAPNISPWRRAVAGDLTSVFDFANIRKFPGLPDGSEAMKRADRQCKLQPPKWEREDLPRQERGRRPARALPYDFDVTGQVVETGFALQFVNPGPAGASFRVSNNKEHNGPWFFAVESGKSLEYVLPRKVAYDFSLLGPNGFFRRFTGAGSERINVAAALPSLKIRNDGIEPLLVRDGYAPDWSATVAPGDVQTVTIGLARTANWYDITVEGAEGYLRQFAGHLEGNEPSSTDPLLD